VDANAADPAALGRLAVQRGLLDEEQLEIALAEHFASGRRLGEILVELGYLDQQQLTMVVDEQPDRGPSRLEVLRAKLESAQVEAARGVALLRERLAAAEAELEREIARRRSAEAAQEAAQSEAVELQTVPETAHGHVLLVPGPGGYQLLERSGQAPPVGGEVGVSGGELVVLKVGASPLPGDRRLCAFLSE
jgi:hypothetical protein